MPVATRRAQTERCCIGLTTNTRSRSWSKSYSRHRQCQAHLPGWLVRRLARHATLLAGQAASLMGSANRKRRPPYVAAFLPIAAQDFLSQPNHPDVAATPFPVGLVSPLLWFTHAIWGWSVPTFTAADFLGAVHAKPELHLNHLLSSAMQCMVLDSVAQATAPGGLNSRYRYCDKLSDAPLLALLPSQQSNLGRHRAWGFTPVQIR